MLERLFQKIFVAIVPTKEGHEVVSVAVKNKKILFKERRAFEGEKPSKAMNRYIEEVIDASPLYYISTLNVKAHQGAYAGCSNEGKNNKNDETGVKSLCRNKKWTLYAS
ncbi:MAG TPA: hypothetical protein VFX57_01640, partial [Sulfuricurvum sp.]|nr:hypothetical protein [Sulfuricurvum sp.]